MDHRHEPAGAERARHGAQDHDHGHAPAHAHGDRAVGDAHRHGAARIPAEHEHLHEHGGRFGWLAELAPVLHGHEHTGVRVDAALASDERGIRALKLSLLGLAATAAFQVVIALASGSAALLADTIHNGADALTAVPLWIAFALGRRAANRRYTYGYGRAEDVAGVVIVAVILASALLAGWESYRKLVQPEPIQHLGWVIAAALIGFAGNEAVALLRIRVGRAIGSAALIADGEHARVDGLTSLAVLLGAVGVWAGFPLADPLIGLVITVAILFIVKDTATMMWRRLMDAVDPELVDALERTAAAQPGVQGVHDVRVRWLGHRLLAELHITVDEDLSTRASHHLAEEVRHALLHAQPGLSTVTVHVDPCGHGGGDAHALTTHHRPARR
jgi:cation diffusion facilitator family transporter